MATRSLGSLTLDLIAKIGGFEQGMNRAARVAADAAKRIENENKRRAEAVQRAWASVAGVIGGIGLAAIGRELIQLGDSYAQLNARISLVTGSQAELDAALRGTFSIAQETRQSFEQTGQLYVRLAQATQQLGRSQEQTLDVTRAINQSLIISGTSSASAAAALVQLGQGFASGVLRGEELNSVLEQAPRLAKAIADGLGVNLGELRKLGQEGALTAEVVFDAILKSQQKLDSEFKKLPPTVDQALTQAGNSVLRLVGLLNEATGATVLLARGIASAAKSLDLFVDRFSNDSIVRAQAEVDTLATRLQIALQSKSPENPGVKLLQAQLDQARKTLAALQGELGTNQSGAETARLRRGNGALVAAENSAPRAAPSNLAGLREQLKELTKLRDEAKIGSEAFGRYNGQIRSVEGQIRSLTGTAATGARERRDASEQLLQSLRDQAERVQDLSAVERTLRELQKAEYATISAQRKEEILDAAKLVDATRERKDAEEALAEAQKQRLQDSRKAAIDELEAITRANTEYQNTIQSLIDATPTAQLEKQRQTVQDLSDEYLRGRFGIVGSEEAVRAYSETVNTFLGNTAEQLEKTKGIGEELGLTFTSAFEDAVVGGKNLREVLTALGDDLQRIFFRELVTKPFGEAASGFARDLFGGGGGGLFSGIGSAIGDLLGFRERGGPVAAGGLYRVNEAGPELLSFGGKDFLMMGASGGNVSPARGGQTSVVNNFSISGSVDRRTEAQISKAATRGVQRAQRWL